MDYKPSPPTSGQWKPGQSGNPAGRPRGKPFKRALEAILDDYEKLHATAAALIAKAHTGDVSAIREVADRMDGKVTQTIGQGDEHGPIELTWKRSK